MAAQNITGKTVHETEYLKVYQLAMTGVSSIKSPKIQSF